MVRFGGIFDFEEKRERLQEVELELADGEVWNDPERAQQLGKERASLEQIVGLLSTLGDSLSDLSELAEMASEENDQTALDDVFNELQGLEGQLASLEFRRMFQGELDGANCYLEIQAGSGGTEAQDWAEMLLRMYLRWAERRGFSVAVTEVSEGDVAGIKGATVNMPTAGCARKPVCTGWCASRPSIPATADIPLLRRSLFLPKSTTTLKLRSIRRMCASTPTAPVGPVVSTSTERIRQCV